MARRHRRDRGDERVPGRLEPNQALRGTGLPVGLPRHVTQRPRALVRHERLRQSPQDPHLPRAPSASHVTPRSAAPPAGAPTPRAHALAILENFHSNLRAIPALAILGSLLAEEERHPELLHLFKTRIVEPRRALLREALAAGDLPDSADLDALTSMLIGSFYGRYVTIDGIPNDWPNRVLSAIWPHDTSPAPPHHDHNP